MDGGEYENNKLIVRAGKETNSKIEMRIMKHIFGKSLIYDILV